MKNAKDRPQPARSGAPEAPRKRFRVEKLEERIAPKKKSGSGANTSLVGGSVY